MKKNQIKFYRLQLTNQFSGMLQAVEEKSQNDYGNKTYLHITHFDKMGIVKYNKWYIDCRYMKNYSISKAVKQFAKNYYGKNLVSIELIKQTKII